MIILDGKVVGTANDMVELTQAEYDALSDEQKTDGTMYYITDATDAHYQKLLALNAIIGTESSLAGKADGTVIGAIADLYSRLGGLSFQVNPATNSMEAIYNDEVSTTAETAELSTYASDEEKIAHMTELVGSKETLTSTGNTTVIGAILDLYTKLADLEFSVNTATNTANVSYEG